MSAYITQLDILGFDGGAAAWTSKVNTVEEGGGGGGAMSAACFTIAPIIGEYTNEWWDILDTASFLSDRIRLNYIRRDDAQEEFFYIDLYVTSEFSGKYPDSITVHYESNLTQGIHNGGNYGFSFSAYDQFFELGNYLLMDHESQIPLNIEFTIPLTYRTLDEDEETPYQSNGLLHIGVTETTGSPQ